MTTAQILLRADISPPPEPGSLPPRPADVVGASAAEVSAVSASDEEPASQRGLSWEELVSIALVGTARRPLMSPESLLEAAAEQVIRKRAGQRPNRGRPLTPAPAETRPLVSRAAGERLSRILDGERARLLPEWLEAATERGVRVPARLLPELLELGVRDRSIRGYLGPLTGARGRWLAGLNPAWSYLLAEATAADHADGEQIWEFGTSGDRQAYISALRATDPDRARELLTAGWGAETPEDRAAFVEILQTGLSMADEPFLEAVLDDRRREVRQAAADLLVRLPGSRLSVRMAGRAGGLLIRSGDQVRVEAPTACDSAMARDGVRARPPSGTGERGWWLQQVVGHTPLSFWPAHLRRPPAEIVKTPIDDWAREVRMGWTRAAIQQCDVEWARALFDVEPLTDLLAVLPADERSRKAAALVRASHTTDGQMIMMLGGLPRPWGVQLAKAVLEKIAEASTTQPWSVVEVMRLAGERLDPAMHAHVERLASITEIQEVAATLRFRHDMAQELALPPEPPPVAQRSDAGAAVITDMSGEEMR